MGACCASGKGDKQGGEEKDYDASQQIFLVGHPGVGKTSLLYKFTDDKFPVDEEFNVAEPRTTTLSDIGAAKKKVRVTIVDTAGQEKFRTITSSFYGNSEGILVVYDVTSKESFEQLESWFTEVDRYAKEEVLTILIGNKVDLLQGDAKVERAVKKEDAEALAEQRGITYLETSAKSGEGVSECFKELTSQILSHTNETGMNGINALE